MKLISSIVLLVIAQLPLQVFAANSFTECLQQQLLISNNSVTIGELKALCKGITANNELLDNEKNLSESVAFTLAEDNTIESAIDNRLKMEGIGEKSTFSLIPHKPNYIILSHNLASPNEQPFNAAFPNGDVHLQPWETKFQMSVKVPLVRDLFAANGDLYAAYTGRFFWQQFNKESSSPFRETNHEPELWFSFKNDSELWGFRNSIIRTGIVHQSNGQAGSLSRSWNRIFTDFIVEKGNAYFSFKPWIRLSEDSDNDDNPDIGEYLGNFELSGVYKKAKHSFSLMTRNNLDFSDNYGAFELGWTFPLSHNINGYVQWFNGYGESLIDYNSHSNSIGFGIKLSDWL